MAESQTGARFPDLYQLLELQPLEDDQQAIEAALQRALEFAKSAQSSNPKAAKKAAKLRELGKLHLLDPQRKIAYDEKWKTEFGASQTPDWKWEMMDGVLPPGDPLEEFDLSAFLEHTADLPVTDPATDFQKLNSLLGGEVPAEAAIEPKSLQPVVAAKPSAKSSNSNSVPDVSPDQAKKADGSTPVQAVIAKPIAKPNGTQGTSPPPASLARKLRKKRDRSLLLAAGGVLVSLAVILAIIFVVINLETDNNSPLAQNPGAGQNPDGQNPDGQNPIGQGGDANQPTVEPPRGSGLPQVPGLGGTLASNGDGANGASKMSGAGMSGAGMSGAGMSGTMGNGDGLPGDGNDSTQNTNTTGGDQNTADQDSVDQDSGDQDNANAADSGAASMPTPPPTPDPALTDAEKQQWQETMLGVRSKLTQQAYEEVNEAWDTISASAKTQTQQEQLIRLKTAASLAEQCRTAIVEAIAGMSAGEMLQVRNTTVAYVEGSESRLTVRMRGQNQSFDLSEIPIGLAWALADLKLDLEHPSSRAKKAAYTLFHPSNQLSLGQARQMLQSAADEGQVPASLMAVFDDDYQL